MTDERWRAAWDVYEEACELPTADQRPFVEAHLTDPAMRQKILNLLEPPEPTTVPEAAEEPEPEWPHLGQAIGRFVVIAPLGRGGMGEVYAARDAELNRTVALKFVSRRSLGTAGALDRFIREAQSASALNHPGIVTVHEVIRSGESVAIVMELVDGIGFRTLCGKPHPADQIANWGRQVAQALAAAHAAHIVHRDIKPDNLVLRPDNLVKILDFGIARDVSHPDQLDRIPLGTLGYMAPEQIAGTALTPAADIFSLGVVLYELAAGKHPFLGKTVSETTSAIALANPELPRVSGTFGNRDLSSLTRAMLAKEPSQRPTAAEVAHRLERIAQRFKGAVSRRALRVAIPVLLVAALGAAWWATNRPQPDKTPPPAVRQFTTLDGNEIQPAFSPDGRKVAFSWDGQDGVNRDIYVQDVGSDTPTRLTTHPDEDTHPIWSHDGARIVFLRKSTADSTQRIMVMNAQGGDEQEVGRFTEFEHFYGPLAWWPDGKSLIVREQSKGSVGFLHKLLPSGETIPLTAPTGTHRDSSAAVSPDGRRFAFVRRSTWDDICIVPLDGPQQEVPKADCIVRGHIGELVWWHGGKELLYTKENAIWRVPADPGAGRIETKVVDGVFQDLTGDPQNHRLAVVKSTSDMNLWRVSRNGQGRVKLIASSRQESDPDYSPDGERIVFRSSRTGTYELWVTRKDGSQWTRLTNFGGGSLGSARFSPDGRQIAFDGWGPLEHTKNGNIYVIGSNGGPPRRLTDDHAIYGVPSWSHDGRWIYFFKRLGALREAWKAPSEGGPAVRVSAGMMFDVTESEDGKYLYYTTQLDAGGIWRRPVEGGEATLVRGTERVQKYRYWKLTPQGIYFVEGPANTAVQFLNFKSGKVTRLASVGSSMLGTARGLAVSPDGKFFIYGQEDARQSDLYLIDGVK